MKAAPGRAAAALLGALGLAAAPLRAEIPLDAAKRFKLLGDLRLRFESDWDSQTANGTPRADRDRARYRARVMFEGTPRQDLTLGLRLRSGSEASQQSAHVTFHDFDDNPPGAHDVLLDRWFARVKRGAAWGWAGRNSFPFWKQNELFWDDDVTPAGLAGGYELTPGAGKLALNAGYFTLPDGGRDFHGRMGAGQVVSTSKVGEVGLTAALGLWLIEGEEGAELLRNGNGTRDYQLWVGGVEARWPKVAGRPLALGLDLMHNGESYAADGPDRFAAANRGETDGIVAQATLGTLRERGDWVVAYTWARIETLAVHASYAQDDWHRWGSGDQTDSSDFTGHELRLGYAFRPNLDLGARLFLAEAITSPQDGKRFRVDLNYRF